jgi:hypothetical protein
VRPGADQEVGAVRVAVAVESVEELGGFALVDPEGEELIARVVPAVSDGGARLGRQEWIG